MLNNCLKILWIKMGGLWPLTSGGRLRSFHIIRELSRHNDVTVLTTHTQAEPERELDMHLPRCEVKSFLFSPPKHDSHQFKVSLAASWFSQYPVDIYKQRCADMRVHAERLLRDREFDVCIADFLTAMPNTPMCRGTPVIMFSHNVEYMIWQRLYDNESSLLKRVLLALEIRKMRRFEALACRTTKATIAVSDADVRLLQSNCREADISAIPTGVDIDYFKPDTDTVTVENSLVFSGSMDWQPNEDAILYFLRDILPLIRASNPAVSMSIVGRNPSALLRKEAQRANVEVTGTVADIRPWLEAASVYIVPLRIGGGTRLKIFEALAMGKAVVSTTIGAEGLQLDEGVHLQRADTAPAFASKVISLLQNRAQRQAMGTAGRKLMEAHYGWPAVAEHFEYRIRDALTQVHAVSDHDTTSLLTR